MTRRAKTDIDRPFPYIVAGLVGWAFGMFIACATVLATHIEDTPWAAALVGSTIAAACYLAAVVTLRIILVRKTRRKTTP